MSLSSQGTPVRHQLAPVRGLQLSQEVRLAAGVTRRGMQVPRSHYFLTSLRTKPKALLRLIRQRWTIENEWHWPRDTQLHEDAHRYANHNGAPLFASLRTVVMSLMRKGGYRSVHAGQQELSHNIRGMLALGGVAASTG